MTKNFHNPLTHPLAYLPKLLGLACILVSAAASAYSVDDGFTADANHFVESLAVQDDGKIIVGGGFTSIAGQPRTRIARLLANGDIDPSFAATAVDGSVNTVLVQPDGAILIGGSFSQVGAFVRNLTARLHADGSVDTSYDPNITGGSTARVHDIVLQPDGKLVIVGRFTTVGGVMNRNIARLNSDGSRDATFNADADQPVNAVVLQADGKLVVAGDFYFVGGLEHHWVARVEADGSVDPTYYGAIDSGAEDLAIQPDGKVLVTYAGSFSGSGSTIVDGIVRLNTDAARTLRSLLPHTATPLQ